MLDLFSLEGKTAIVTGGASGIGAAIVQGFEFAGAEIVVFDIEPNTKYKDEYNCVLDVRDERNLQSAVSYVKREFGHIDILVNCAGVTLPSWGEGSEEYSMEDWKKTLDINLTGTFNMCQLVSKQMIKQGTGGSIINITSLNAEQGWPSNPAYLASKGGVKSMSKGFANDLGKYNIRVNCLGPGYTHTRMNTKSWNDLKMRKDRADRTMLGRWAEPEEYIGPAVFLASEASSYVTGIDLYVDGGWLAKGM